MVSPHYNYSPIEIKDASSVFIYADVLGKYQYERILHKNIADSQRAGQWVPVLGPFSDVADRVLDYKTQTVLSGQALEEFMLQQLTQRGILIQNGYEYYFAPQVIEKVVEKYRVWIH